jgi:hypothetical protein
MHKSAIRSLVALAYLNAAVLGGQRLEVGEFSSTSLTGWETKSFEGEADYAFVEIDGRKVVARNATTVLPGLY